MARLITSGMEVGIISASLPGAEIDGAKVVIGTGTVATDVTTVRTGAQSCKCNTGATGATAGASLGYSLTTTGSELWCRGYINFATLPSAEAAVAYADNTVEYAKIKLTATGTLKCYRSTGGGVTEVQVGSESAVLITTGVWYRFEILVDGRVGPDGGFEFRLDGNTLASITGLGFGTAPSSLVEFGWGDTGTAGSNKICFVDDVAVNDEAGASQNSWPGSGKVVLLRPISDSQRGSWTGGVGGTTNLFDAVNNTPPIGTATETDLTQIESVDTTGDNATDEYRATMTTYTTAGIVASDTITLCQGLVNHGEDVAAGTKTGSFLILSNPAQVTADTFTFGDDAGLLGTWSSNWRTKWGAAQIAPAPTLGTSPVMRIRKTDAGSAVASVDFMGIYVEYAPAAAAVTAARRLPLLGAGL